MAPAALRSNGFLVGGNLASSEATGSLSAMTVGRVFPLVLGLWGLSAFGQAMTQYEASSTIFLDGGVSYARAYVVTVGQTEYAMANAGEGIQVFKMDGSELPVAQELLGTYTSFAVVSNVVIGPSGPSGTTTLVAAADVGASCSLAFCLRIFFWDPTSGFGLQNTASTSSGNATAMAIDSASSPMVIYYTPSLPTFSLWSQDITVSSSNGAVAIGSFNTRTPTLTGSQVLGLAVNDPTALYATDDANVLYAFPLDLSTATGGPIGVSNPTDGGFSLLRGISFFSPSPGPSFLLGGGLGSGVYKLNPADGGVSEVFTILAAGDAGQTFPSSAAFDPSEAFLLVTEDISAPLLHIVSTDAGPDGGAGTDGGTTPDAGSPDSGIPTVPIIAPGPGALPGTTNSCNCSTAGSAPVLLVLLLPLLVSRRRRW